MPLIHTPYTTHWAVEMPLNLNMLSEKAQIMSNVCVCVCVTDISSTQSCTLLFREKIWQRCLWISRYVSSTHITVAGHEIKIPILFATYELVFTNWVVFLQMIKKSSSPPTQSSYLKRMRHVQIPFKPKSLNIFITWCFYPYVVFSSI